MKSFGICILCVMCMLSTAVAMMPPYPDSTKALAKACAEVSRLVDYDHGAPVQPRGSWSFLVVCVDFADKPFQTQLEFFDTLVFGNEKVSTMTEFYTHNSYGKFSLTTQHLPSQLYVRAPQPYTSYVDNDYGLGSPPNISTLLNDVLDAIDTLIDFSDYVNHGDDEILGVAMIHAGPGAERTGSSNDIWSHAGRAHQTRDGIVIRKYMIVPELYSTPGDMQIGVFAHEFGHILGLPDLYDRDGSSRGVGAWSLMSIGCWNGVPRGFSPASLDAWCKSQLGFVELRIVDREESMDLRPIQVCDTVLWVCGYDESRYYLIENRQRMAYDVHTPGNGLLIWRIDETRSDIEQWNDNEWYPDHEDHGNYLVALTQSDGRWDLERNKNDGDPLDSYPGYRQLNTEFGPDTYPSSDWYNGTPTQVRIWNIARSGRNITFSITTDLSTDVLEPVTPGGSQSFAGRVEVFNILGQRVAEVHGTCLNGNIQRCHAIVRCLHRGSGIYFLRMVADRRVYVKKIIVLR